MDNILKITAYTLKDQLRHKSVYVLLGLSIFFILMIRGCYDGNFSMNGKMVDSITVAWYVSKIVFHLISVGMFLMVSLLSMKILTRDHEDGTMVLFLARPVSRWQYITGRMFGTWLLCLVFMFILHLNIFLTVWTKTGGIIPGYLMASLICSINLLFITLCVCLFSLFMPDFISALFALGILFVGFISDGGHQIFSSELARSIAPSASAAEPALWRVLFPKVFMVQTYADSLFSKGQFYGMGPVHPLLNVFAYVLLLSIAIILLFNRKEI